MSSNLSINLIAIKDPNSQATSVTFGKKWLFLNNSAKFQSLYQFNLSESLDIYNELTTGGTNLIFDEYGNVSIESKFTYNSTFKSNKNEANPGVNKQATVAKIKLNYKSTNMYEISPNGIMNNNLIYILYNNKPGDNSSPEYHLLYNPLQDKNFKDYYNSKFNSSNNTKNPGITNDSDIYTIFNNYCYSMVILNNYSHHCYIDPFCNMIAGFPNIFQYAYSNLQTANIYLPSFTNPVNSTKEMIYSFMTDQRSLFCSGVLSKIQLNNISLFDNSFILDLINNAIIYYGTQQNIQEPSTCGSKTINICTMVNNSAGNINIKNSKLSNSCGSSGNTTNQNTTIVKGQNLTDNINKLLRSKTFIIGASIGGIFVFLIIFGIIYLIFFKK